ncbi:MAG: phage portal protein [Bryobacteraceae bacterium]
MNFLRRLIRRAFPPEAGMPYHSLRWPAVPNSPNPTPANDLISRSRAEQEVLSSGDARRIVSAWSGALVGGSGLTPMFRDPELRRLWDTWCGMPDAAGRLDWVGLLQQITETMVTSGEAFVLLQISETAPGIPLSLLVLPPEYLDTSKSDGSTVIAGIAFNGLERTGYHLLPHHPAMPGVDLRSVFIPAADCLHVFRAVRPTDQRAVTWFSPVLYLMRLKREYIEADVTRQKTSALVCGFVRSPSGTLNPFATPGNPNGSVISLEPATMTMLPAEAEVTFSNPVDHSPAFDPFMKTVTRQIFAGMNLPYELSGDLGNVTFASGRAGILEFRRQVEAIQYGVLIPLLAQPILNRWLELASALGYAAAAEERPRWACPSPQALDARAEVLTDILRVRAGFASRREIVESAGWVVDDVDREISDDQARARGLGLTLDVDSRMTQQGQEQPTQETPQ